MKYTSQTWDPNISEMEKSFRTFINNDQALTYFLETGTMRKNAKFAKETIYSDPAFLAFISPYYEPVYTAAVIRSFDTKDTNLMGDVAGNPILLDVTHKQKAFAAIEQHLEQKLRQLQNTSLQIQQGGFIVPAELEETSGIMVICVLNYLPIEFQSIRTKFAVQIVNTAKALMNRDFELASSMATNVRQLKADAQATYDADALYQSIERVRESAQASAGNSDGGGGGISIWGIIGIILIIIKLILLFAR